MRFLPCGPRALLVELDDADAARALAAEVARRRAGGWAASLADVVPGARTVLLDGLDDPPATAREIAGWPLPPVADGDGPLVEIPCVYDGPDLLAVATAWGCDAGEVADRHGAMEWTVAFCGFAPGFAYLSAPAGLGVVPRRGSPRPRVPAGSIALAGEYCGIYPRSSPGGWQLIATTDAALWDVGRDPPALLAPGTRVRFHAR